MSKHKVGLNGADEPVDHNDTSNLETEAPCETNSETKTDGASAMSIAATIGVVVVGAAVLEATLIPGILVGAAAAFAPKFLPKLGERMQPLFNSTVRGACKLGRKARSAYGEAQERIHDIAAEVHAEETQKATESVA
jgi:hypothetical protein